MRGKKVVRNCSEEAAFVGVFIFALMQEYLEESEKRLLSSVALQRALLHELRKCDNGIVKRADAALQEVMDELQEKRFSAYVSLIIETLYFNAEHKMRSMYGSKIGDLVVRFSMRIDVDGDAQTTKNSYMIADMFSDAFKRAIKKENAI